MPSKRAARLKRKKQKRWEQLPKAKPPLVPDEFAAERRGMEIFLRQTTAFRLALALYNDPVARDEAIKSLRKNLSEQGTRLLTLDLREPSADRTLLARVRSTIEGKNLLPGERLALSVVNLESQVDYTPELAQVSGPGTDFLKTTNLHRELFPAVCSGPLVLWTTEMLERAFVSHAPDLWHWRSHVFDLRTRNFSTAKLFIPKLGLLPNHDHRRHPEDRLHRLEEELVAYRKIGAQFDECRILNAIGVARFDLGDARNARHDFEEALLIARGLSNKMEETVALGNIGNALAAAGSIDKAIDAYTQSLNLAREINYRSGEGGALQNLGKLYGSKGETSRAIENGKRALDIAREVGDPRAETGVLINLGDAHSRMNELIQSAELYEKALHLARNNRDKQSEGVALGSLGNAYSALGEDRKALNFYNMALSINREVGDRRDEAISLWNIACISWNAGDFTAAINHATRALTIFGVLGHPNAEVVEKHLEQWQKQRG